MKKNISINISGIIFHIEEDGYDQLKNYLDSISRYFSTFEDSTEIIADIENRIAEIFSQKLTESKQVITSEDVLALIATMGTISDFQAFEEEGDKASEATNYQSTNNTYSDANSATSKSHKKLFRDGKRKLLGGVAAGIANYLVIDPLWIRLLFVALFFGIFFLPSLSGITALAYFILWIVLPEGEPLEETEKIKKFFRNPEERVIGGVCSGIAAYFAADVILVRILFVIGIFLGGSTLILYLILWIITPEARTITEKMKMQGEPVTLSNIEQNIKRNLNVQEGEEENTLTKILLFPFRIIAIVFTALGKMLGPLLIFIGEFVRIVVGIILIFVPIILLIVFISFIGSALGLGFGYGFIDNNWFPFEVLTKGLPKYGIIAAAMFVIIPLFSFILSGASLLAKRRLFHPAINWSLGGLMIISTIITVFTIPPFLNNFSKEGKYEVEKTYTIPSKTIFLKANPNEDFEYSEVEIYIRGHEENAVRIVEKYQARGFSRKDAQENAKMVNYNYEQTDSSFVFDWNFEFKEDAAFRGQNVEITIYIPYGKEFVIGNDLDELLRSHNYFGHNFPQENSRWVIQKDGMKCISCPANEDYEHDDNFDFHSDDNNNYNYNRDNDEKDNFSFDFDWDEEGTTLSGATQSYGLTDFTGLSVSGFFIINVIQGDEFKVRLNGKEKALRNVKVRVEDNLLNVDMKSKGKNWGGENNKVRVDIVMPKLEEVDFSGITNSRITGFKSDNFQVNLNGGSNSKIDIITDNLEMNVSGGAKVELKGKANYAHLELNGATDFNAFDFRMKQGELEINGASSSKVYATEFLKIDASGPCEIRYKGNPKLEEHTSFLSKVHKED